MSDSALPAAPGELERVFQAPARLRIMAAIMARGETDFTELIDLLQLTRGNLSAHMKMLDDCGLVETAKAFVNKRPRTTYRVTPRGQASFREYVAAIQEIIASARTV